MAAEAERPKECITSTITLGWFVSGNLSKFQAREMMACQLCGHGSNAGREWHGRNGKAAASGGFGTLGIEVEKLGFRTAWLITGQKFQGLGLKLTAVILTSRDLASHVCQKIMRMARWRDLNIMRSVIFKTNVLRGFDAPGAGIFKTYCCCEILKNGTQNLMFRPFRLSSY